LSSALSMSTESRHDLAGGHFSVPRTVTHQAPVDA
jgi:hypothetical protein